MIALDPATGTEIWRFDAGVDRTGRYSEVTSRGVSAWRDSGAALAAPCARRIFAGTIDARLLALDAATGTTVRRLRRPAAPCVWLPEPAVDRPARLPGDLAAGGASATW